MEILQASTSQPAGSRSEPGPLTLLSRNSVSYRRSSKHPSTDLTRAFPPSLCPSFLPFSLPPTGSQNSILLTLRFHFSRPRESPSSSLPRPLPPRCVLLSPGAPKPTGIPLPPGTLQSLGPSPPPCGARGRTCVRPPTFQLLQQSPVPGTQVMLIVNREEGRVSRWEMQLEDKVASSRLRF